ncbi:hypothetical protein ACW2Q0_28135 [Nocardia sp. R16R-3T]
MTDLGAIANLLVGGGVSGVLVALIGGLFSRSTRRGDAARVLVEASGEFADRADARAERLEIKLAKQESATDRLKERLWKWADLMRQAIPLLRDAGHSALADRMAAALESGTPPPDPPGPAS